MNRQAPTTYTQWHMAESILTIVLPYRGAERLMPVWADGESEVVFRRLARRACRCTMAFAAMELRRYLTATCCREVLPVYINTRKSELNFSRNGCFSSILNTF